MNFSTEIVHVKRSGPPSRGFDNRGSKSNQEVKNHNHTLSNVHEGGTMTVSAEEAKMMQLLRQNQIGLAELTEMIYGTNQNEGGVTFSAPTVLPYAQGFEISGGYFAATNQQHVFSTTTHARQGGSSVEARNEGRLGAPTQTRRDVMGHANNFTNQENRAHNNPSRGGVIEGSNVHTPSTPAQITYGPQQSHNPYWSSLTPGSSTRSPAHRMDPSLEAVRHRNSGRVNILGPSVMAKASNFALGEGAILEPGALSAAGSQTIYQLGVESDYSN